MPESIQLGMDDIRPLPGKGKSIKHPPTIVFDPSRCTGCGTCEMVCSARQVNAIAPSFAAVKNLRSEERGNNFTVLCLHCQEPLCIPACPVRAIEKGKDGIVRINPALCTGCGICALACPEAAPMITPDGTVRKCDLCDGDPACVKCCPEGALTFTRGKRLGWIRWIRWPVQVLAFFMLVMVLAGTFCYFKAGSVSLACPAGFLQNLASTKILVLTGLVSASVLLVLTLFLGRIFCGFICPFGFFLDLVGKIVPKFGLPGFLKGRLIKYGILAGAVGTSAGLGCQAFCTVCPIGSLCRSYGPNGILNGFQLGVFPVVAALEMGEKRSWCRYFCPVGAVLALAAKIGVVKIVIGAQQCKKFSCMQCADVCPMGIIDKDALRQGISPEIPMSECIMCMRCIDACRYGGAKIRFRWQKTAPLGGKI
ncbi:iron-sulfur cluster-binding protein [Desulforapulum autotrophicum HRM2]|uniref:Iron-sulfur cluster-binding protein n=1 Tax=Desulforapulum autotrophicum (strain ATCC 43914 / DSM 3382 / VKM B-1955 / HRM2) TaxID=177437 RepID=C0Q9I4_DESAH|nr:4Fe-4S dicluster domain-containing protein [Desulforapulum autotrophicum]ACN14548.1 iron-sulfur cluster-binding protein [Desulforapulum autotrophicum HRM2]